MKMKRTPAIAAAAVSISALVLASYFSPHWDLYRMKSAVEKRDADGFSRRVDFPALRESIKAQLGLALDQRMPGTDDKPLAGLGRMMATALIGPIIDAAVSPAGVMRMFEAGSTKAVLKRDEGAAESSDDSARANYAVAYRNWDTVSLTQADGKSGAFILKRAGLWSWKLAAIELPAQSLASTR